MGLSETARLPKEMVLIQPVEMVRPSAAGRAVVPYPQSPVSQPKILVADDSRTIRLLVQRALMDAGYAVAVAADGREAVRSAQDDCPQLVILDIQMPEMDGYAACEQLRALGKPWSELPIILLTSVQARALSLLGSELGAYLSKPVCMDQLLETVASLLRRKDALDPSLAQVRG